ncbi:hypothetical protein LOTGIDRAFT_152166 [Lottia gigantea]|uniref:Major facilitator superfamily (MFS) profile domain-containing protein n=1 Tax=Lottia gigantea TaxID=225164 RepID=V4BHB0_LOTGI|nr:hypothetical protein LOTGIDRAFT_152166 [Lottia gigantea]ESP05327.1 hypothetical protein LOTGIDRAFT_152166 [Lottia gigantea]
MSVFGVMSTNCGPDEVTKPENVFDVSDLVERKQELRFIYLVNLIFLEKIGAEGAFSVCFFYTPELFPTNVRNVGLGSASVAARTGGMIAPFSRLMIQHIPWGPGAIFSIFCLVSAFLVIWLPETKEKQLPQTMADIKLLYPKGNRKAVKDVELEHGLNFLQ